jgi:Protein of unknown function, DUF481
LHTLRFTSILAVLVLILPCGAQAQAALGPDLLVLTSGERLTGHLQDAVNGNVDFQSDALGKISVPWVKIQELRTAEPFAVIRKNVKVTRNVNVNTIPQGTITANAQTITLMPVNASAQTIPVADVSTMVGQGAFLSAVQHNPSLLKDWTGTASFGAALVEATQSSVSVTSSISLTRAIPAETWLPPRNRTTADFTSTYGSLSQPATPVIKTSIFHADAERDEYFTQSFYALADTAFDHNFSMGLDLQQIYGFGIGWTALKNDIESLYVQGSVTYERQSFFVPALDDNLVGSIFSEAFNRKFADGVTLTQKLAFNPAWNVLSAYSMNASIILAVPLYKHFNFSTTLADAFLNNSPPGFRKNSFQFITALGYTFGAK